MGVITAVGGLSSRFSLFVILHLVVYLYVHDLLDKTFVQLDLFMAWKKFECRTSSRRLSLRSRSSREDVRTT
jgi:hypothetical protein